MGIEYLQSNLTGGEISPTLHARTDIDKHNTSVAIAENVVIVPQGGLRRRPGLKKIAGGNIGQDARLIPFVFNKTQQYLLVFLPNVIKVFRDDVQVATVDISSVYTSMDIIDSLDVIQSADTVIMTTETVAPHRLVRGATDADWTFDAIPLVVPQYDFGSGYEDVWSDARGWPLSCTFHMGRLWFGGSTQKPTSVWGSRVQGFFDFTWDETVSPIPDDHGVFDTIDTDQYNKITNIFSARGLQVFTTGGEFFNTVDMITPSNSAWKAQTGYGSKGIRPIFIDGATLFVDSSGRNIREFVYDFNEDAHVANSITLLASHLLTDIKSLASIKGTNIDISDYVYAVNSDGSLAVMNTLRKESILGWTHWTTQGNFIDVCVVDKQIYFLVQRNGSYFIEKVDEDSYTDHNMVETGTDITTIQTNFDSLFDNTVFKVVADYSMMQDSTPTVTSPGVNSFTIDRTASRIEVGLDFTAKIVTLPIATTLQNGNTLHRRKRVVKVDLDVYETLGMYVNNISAPDRKFTVVLDNAPEPATGLKEVFLLGYDRIVQFEVSQKNPLPMLLRGIGYEIEY